MVPKTNLNPSRAIAWTKAPQKKNDRMVDNMYYIFYINKMYTGKCIHYSNENLDFSSENQWFEDYLPSFQKMVPFQHLGDTSFVSRGVTFLR